MTTFTFTNVINPLDKTFNQLLGINDGGVIVGYYGSGAAGHPNKGYTTTTVNHTAFTPEDFPGSVQTQVTGLNNGGKTVGFWSNTNLGGGDANFGFFSPNPSRFTSIQDPHTTSNPPVNQLLGINNNGIAAGFFNNAGGNSRGYTYNTKLGTFSRPIIVNGASTTATGIDDAGTVVGFFATGGPNFEGFLKMGTTVEKLQDPGMVSTQILGINANGTEVVGDAVGPGGGMFGFTFDGTTWQNFHVGIFQGKFATTFNGVNDAGEVVGFYVNSKGNTIGLLARPSAPPAGLGIDSYATLNAATGMNQEAFDLLSPSGGAHTSTDLHSVTTHAPIVAVGSVGHG